MSNMAVGPQAKGYALGNAILAFFAPGGFGDLSSLNLKVLNWARKSDDLVRSYPANPYLLCPRLRIRLLTQDLQMGPPRGGQAHDAQYKISLVYQRRHNILEDHQQLMIQDTETIFNSFTQFLVRVPNIEAVQGWENFKSYPLQIAYHDDLEHEFGDPNMSVSVSEIVYTIEGRLATYYIPPLQLTP